jgi:tripartite-type tricarboxylate transporter receptor subunit TctC
MINLSGWNGVLLHYGFNRFSYRFGGDKFLCIKLIFTSLLRKSIPLPSWATIIKFSRIALCLVLICVARTNYAQAPSLASYPSKPIRLIVPFPAGGGNDVVARVIAQKLSERLGQPIVVDNKAGANGIVGIQALIASAPDGYTLAVASAGPIAVNPSLYERLSYDPVKDLTSITNLVSLPLLLVTHPSLPVKNIKELIALAKTKPDQLYFCSPGSGNSAHLAGELFNAMADVKLVHVPYKGQGPAMADLLSGQVQMLFSSIPPVLPYVHSGQLNALAIGNSKRISTLPEIPTVSESGVPGFEAYSWVGLFGPPNMPKELVHKINKEFVDVLKLKDVGDRLNREGALPVGDTAEEFSLYVKKEIIKWGAVVKSANIKAD